MIREEVREREVTQTNYIILAQTGWRRVWELTNWHVIWCVVDVNKNIHTRALYNLLNDQFYFLSRIDLHDRTRMVTHTLLRRLMLLVCEFNVQDECKAQTSGILGAAGRWPPHCTRLVIVHQRVAGPRLTDLQYSWMPPNCHSFPSLFVRLNASTTLFSLYSVRMA